MTTQTPAANLIQTKLNQPRVVAHLMQRERLYAPLDLHRPLTLVVAPAGYGKTVLVSQWAAQSGMRCAWLSLDAGDNRLSTFVDYFLASVERLFPDVVHATGVNPSQGAATPYSAIARKLADELDAIDENFVLVLDDYHFIDEPAIHRFVTELLRFPPRNLNLVIVSRVDPPLPLAALRARAHLSEVRTSALRFTPEEATEYLRQEFNQDVDRQTLDILEDSTEGWITGLRLAVLFLRDQEDVALAAAQFKTISRFTADYLALEVLAKQQPIIQSFLLKTSILERMCPALCDALFELEPALQEGRHFLDALERQNLFLMTLDDKQRWYSYHPLFRQLLQSHLRATCPRSEIASLYNAASRWCAGQELIDEGIAYAVAADDPTFAIAVIEQHRHRAMNEERWPELERWLYLVGRRNIESSPHLLMLEAWLLHKRQHLNAVPGRLDLAEALLANHILSEAEDRRLRSEIDALRSQQYFRQFDGERTVRSACRALEHAPAQYSSVRGVAWVFYISGYFLNHGLQAALALLPDEADEVRPLPVVESSRILLTKCFLYWMAGDLPSLRRVASSLLNFAEVHNLPESVIWARYFHGCACYEQGDLALAGADFLSVVSQQHMAPGFALSEATFGLASVLQAQSNPSGARAALESIAEYGEQTGNATIVETVDAYKAYLALLQDRPMDAIRWVSNAARGAAAVPIVTFFAPPVAAAAILIRHGSPASLAEAELMLSRTDALLRKTHIDRMRVEVLIQQALLYDTLRRHADALTTLEAAVTMAESGGVVQPFVDAGPPMANLLARLRPTVEHDAFAQRLRQASRRATPDELAPGHTTRSLPSMPLLAQPRHADLIELLTNRELEVLQLLALRLSNFEIARDLNVTAGTVKQHTINIYRKLHVENRRQAIVQAKAMGFKIETPYPF